MMSLFHFTDVNAVHSILTNRSIWLTDLRFLNDSRELYDGIDIFSEILEHPKHGLFTNNSYREQSSDYLRKAFSDSCSYGIDEEPIFVFSLSRVGTLLSQWRSYGSYAIEFDEKIFRSEVSGLRECIYDQSKKRKTAESLVTQALAKISQEMANREGLVGVESLDALIRIIEFAAIFKDEGFYEELEMRIVTKEQA